MNVKKTNHSPTSVTLQFSVHEAELLPIKQKAVAKLGANLKIAGFRPGKAPQGVIEKNIDQSLLQTEVLEEAVNNLYVKGVEEHQLRPVGQPEISIKKFVPFTTLEFEAKMDVVGEIKLADYKKIKKTKEVTKVLAKDVQEVLDSLKVRAADKKDVSRAAKNGDQVIIDFSGKDTKGKPVAGAEGTGYPLILGSNSFIPGFEDNLIGMKAGDEKSFEITFPKDYGVHALANSKVTFTVKVGGVQEVVEPKIDDEFAKKVGPFKTVEELKADIKKQLTAERQNELDRKFEQELIEEIAKKSTVNVPEGLIEEQLDAAEREERQNLMYRGQTWEEHLKDEGVTESEHRERNRKSAEERVKAGLVLSEISEKEQLSVTPEELEMRIQLYKGQYQDAAMQAELDKPENRRDIAMRILTEKTINKLTDYATAK